MKARSIKVNAALNTVKQCCQVLFPVITIPYVTRVLGVDNYGKINFSNSIVSYFLLLASLGINSYAIREGALVRNNKKIFEKFSDEVFTINVISTIISYFVLFMVICIPQVGKYKSLILIQSLVIILTTIGADWVNSIYEDYLYISFRYILFQLIAVILLFIFVKTSSDYLKYALILVIGTAGGNVLNIFYIRRYVHLELVFHFNWARHLIPILVLFGNQVAITLYVNSDVTMLGLLSSERMVGLYSLSSKIYTVVQQVLNALLIVTIPRLSFYIGERRNEDFQKLADRVFRTLLTLMAPLVTGLFSFSKEIMELAGGEQYTIGSSSLKILSITLLFSLIAGYFTNCILLPKKLEKRILLITSTAAIINVFFNLIFIPTYGANGASITTLLSELVVSIWSYKIAKKFLIHRSMKRDIGSILVGCICIYFICYISELFLSGSMIIMILCSVIVSVLVYFIILFVLGNSVVRNKVRSI